MVGLDRVRTHIVNDTRSHSDDSDNRRLAQGVLRLLEETLQSH